MHSIEQYTERTEWYKIWFDSSYYHLLYQHRDEREAKFLIDNLMPRLRLPIGAKVLDLACGRGRHAVYLNAKGFQVTGLDLSEASIDFAKPFENELLKFDVHNSKYPYALAEFDAVFNLFTSFGYENHDSDNYSTIRSAADSLKPNGYFVLDYLNEAQIRKENLKSEQSVFVGKTQFQIKRQIIDNFVTKTIEVIDHTEQHIFTERVKLYSSHDLMSFFKQSGLTIMGLYGNYQFEAYQKETSPRHILIGKK